MKIFSHVTGLKCTAQMDGIDLLSTVIQTLISYRFTALPLSEAWVIQIAATTRKNLDNFYLMLILRARHITSAYINKNSASSCKEFWHVYFTSDLWTQPQLYFQDKREKEIWVELSGLLTKPHNHHNHCSHSDRQN